MDGRALANDPKKAERSHCRHPHRDNRILEDYDSLKVQKDHYSRDELRQDLVQRCWQFESKLALWTVQISDATYQALEVPDTPFSIDVLASSHLVCIYWCACVYVYNTLRDLLSAPEVEWLPPSMDSRIYFRNIAEVVDVMLHPSSGIFGSQLAYFSTAVVMTHIRVVAGEGGEEARTVISEVYRRARKDRIMGQFLASLRGQIPMARCIHNNAT